MSVDQNNEKQDNGYKDVKYVIKNSYLIKSYQRGYRWDTNNIKELLEDIFEGKLTEGNIPDDLKESDPEDLISKIEEAIKHNGESNYCLQPLVVKQIKENKNSVIDGQQIEENKYSVIDGQQRLTSLFVIFKALSQISDKKFPESFSLEYQSRPNSKEFLKKLNKDSEPKNIDAEYIKQAFDFATKWFLGKNREFIAHLDSNGNDDPGKMNSTPDKMNSTLASYMYAVLTEKTHFIWDEIDKSSKENEQKIFADRNTGKLELTDSELIKSLFMNPEYYGSQKNNIGDRQILISEIWDIYENELHKAELWAFLPLPKTSKENYASRTRIDAIFYLLVKKEGKEIRQEDNSLFKAVQKWILDKRTDAEKKPPESDFSMDPMAHVMHQCWRDVCNLMDGIVELYENNEIYNLLSLYKMAAANDDKSVLDAYLEILNKPKDERPTYIKEKIINRLFGGKIEKRIKATIYPSKDIKILLIAHNVAIINTNTPIERFAFKFFEEDNSDKYKKYKWEREHIYATNESYIEKADIHEKISILKLFSDEDSYKNYINYLYDINIDEMEKDFDPSKSSGSNFTEDCFIQSQNKYGMYLDIWRCLKLKEKSSDLLLNLDIKEELDVILSENDENKKRRLELFLQNTEYDNDGRPIYLNDEYLPGDDEILSRLLDEIFDNTGIEAISLDNHGPKNETIVKDENFQLLITFIGAISGHIEDKVNKFFKKGEPIDSEKPKVKEDDYKTFSDFINDNSMGNMMLLPKFVNGDGEYRSNNLDGKRKRVSEMKNVFLPIASTNVLLGKYNELGSGVRQWLMEERKKYLEDMINTMTGYYGKE